MLTGNSKLVALMVSETASHRLTAGGSVEGPPDIGAETLEFDIAAVLGRTAGRLRCELSYRRCETPIEEMLEMIKIEVEEIERIQKEVENDAIDLNSITERLDEEAAEVADITVTELTTPTTTVRPANTTTAEIGRAHV